MSPADQTYPVLIIAGVTGCGKTSLCHTLADRWMEQGHQVVIINMDAFQMVRHFDVGTAKPTAEERRRYRYEFIDVVDPDETPDAQTFGSSARETIARAQSAGARVLVVGGSGLYMRSLLHGLDDGPPRQDHMRAFFRDVERLEGSGRLHGWLQRLDPVRAAQVHPHDYVRIERALEIYFATGVPMSALGTRTPAPRAQQRLFGARVIAIQRPTAAAEARMRQRTATLIGTEEDGPWIGEVRHLLGCYGKGFFDLYGSRAIGYVDVAQALQRAEGRALTPPERAALVERIVVATRQYGKRQRTWLGSAAVDVTLSDDDEIAAFASSSQ